MKVSSSIAGRTLIIVAVALGSCGRRSVEGSYDVTNAPVSNVVAKFGKDSFSFSSGASARGGPRQPWSSSASNDNRTGL